MGQPVPPHPSPEKDRSQCSWADLPIAVSGMANSVFSLATRNRPWTDRPTPCGWRRTKVRGGKKKKKKKKKINAMMKRGGNRGLGWAKRKHTGGKQGRETLITVTSTETPWAKVWDGKCWLKKKSKPGRPYVCVCVCVCVWACVRVIYACGSQQGERWRLMSSVG